MQTYCSHCRKVTEDVLEKEYWNTNMDRVTAHCGECNFYKYCYLEKKEFENGKS